MTDRQFKVILISMSGVRVYNKKLLELGLTLPGFVDRSKVIASLPSLGLSSNFIEKVDFRTAFNYSMGPEINRIKKAKFSISGISGLLDKYDIDIEK